MNPIAEKWDARYAAREYQYGATPNLWLESQASRLPASGQALALADGEGRNGVWLARQGLDVTAVDASAVGLAKGRELALREGVETRYHTQVALLEEWDWPVGPFHVVASLFLHLPMPQRRWIHRKAAAMLAPGGLLVLEAFTPRQLEHRTGGPDSLDLLYEPDDLREDFAGLEILHLEENVRLLEEGRLHRGPSAVVRLLARA